MVVTLAPPAAPPRRSGLGKVIPAERPQRILAAATFINTLGSGMFMTSSALYFTRVVGLPIGEVAFGLFIGAMAGLITGIAAGRVADRLGARETQIVVMFAGAVFIACFLLTKTFWPFVLVSIATGLIYAGDKSSRAPLIRGFSGDNPSALRAYLRSVANLAIALGALVAGLAIEFDSKPIYLGMIIGRSVAFLGSGLILMRLPRLEPIPAPVLEGRWIALRDRPYAAATLLNCVMSLHFAVPTFLLPLWIVDHTDAPRWMVSGALVLNTVMVVGLQVIVSRGVHTVAAAGVRMRWAGLALFVSLTIMGLSAGMSPLMAVVLLLVGVAIYTLGELWHAAAAMEYMFGMAPPHAQGQYAGVFGLGGGLAEALAPSVLAFVGLGLGRPGWIVLGLIFLTVGVGSTRLISFATRNTTERITS